MLGKTKLDLENVLAFVAGVMTTVAFWELYPEAFKANEEELRTTGNRMFGRSRQQQQLQPLREAPMSFFSRTEYRPILWGTVVGTLLMVATELYLP